MSAARELPARPSLDSLRKQAKRLARDAAAGNGEAVARVHAQLPRAALPLSNRDAQLVVAREYGFAGWADLNAEVQKRLGGALEWAASEAKVAIHDEDHERLRTLLAEHPALASWRDENGEALLSSTTPYALDVSDPERERIYTRPVAAEMLIDAGVTVEPSTWEHLIGAGASGMLRLLERKHVLPRTLPVLAALGDDTGVGKWLDDPSVRDDTEALDEQTIIERAIVNACRFGHADIALRLLDRAIALDPDLGRRIDHWRDRPAFVEFLSRHPGSHWSGGPTEGRERSLWEAFVIRQLTSAQDDNDLSAFRRWLEEERWVLDAPFVPVQIGLIERASYGRMKEPFISALLERDPALLRIHPPPKSSAIDFALDYGNARLIPELSHIWSVPHDLAHAAGTGDAAAVARWLDASEQPVPDVALAWAVLNHHFEIASLLLERGADINSDWGTHEPASILHEAAIHANEAAVRFLIDRGADLTKEDYRYRSTAEGWARYGANDEHMADLLAAPRASRAPQAGGI